MTRLTVSSALIAPAGDRPLTPGMVKVVWQLAGELDRNRVPASVDQAVWVRIPAAQLRGAGGRDDNVWLRECLDRLTGLKLSGETPRAGPWGAVLVAEWRLEAGGSIATLLVPPAAVAAMRAPGTFAKLDEATVYSLPPNAARLYALLADKARQSRSYWDVDLPSLRSELGVGGKKAYEVWGAFRRSVLDPSVAAVNEAGAVQVEYRLKKLGRSVVGVTIRWRWRDLMDATDQSEQMERHSVAAGKPCVNNAVASSAPPLIPELVGDQAAQAWSVMERVLGAVWAKSWGRDLTVQRKDGSVTVTGSPLAIDQLRNHPMLWQAERELAEAGLTFEIVENFNQ